MKSHFHNALSGQRKEVMKNKQINGILLGLSIMALCLSCKSEPGPCDAYNEVLNGYFETSIMEGTWRFSGGKAGTIIIRGLDYNDMDCGYQITNCETGDAHMNCEGAGLDKRIQVISQDEIKVGDMTYKRISK